MRREIEGGTLEMWARVGDVAVLAVAGASSAALSAALIVALFPWLQRYALARPNARSSHVTPTAQGGGAAVILAALIVTWVLIVLGYARGSGAAVPSLPAIALVSLVVIAIAALGAIDDIRPLPVTPRLALQFLAAAALVWTVPAPMRALPFLPRVIESALLIVGLVWFINLTNFMDGIDGITVAEMVPISVTLAVLGVASVLPPPAGLIAWIGPR